ncbi:hypothetical protein [Acetobacter orientalis]|uniref:hypothetical protein n=1 Tax=Acetobacter orientalis TaxID=146474 RepID=UPI00241FE330|nr:hypothetical protein [Acetobacter orientalis]
MEPATHDDLWDNFIRYRPELQTALKRLLHGAPQFSCYLVVNPVYAAAMCRVHLLRQPDPLPAANDAAAWAAYWKQHYNTAAGAGVAAQAVPCFRAAMEA